MFYFVVLGIIIINAIIDLIRKRNSKIISTILLLILTFILCFRFGQGTDFFNYRYMYYTNSKDFHTVITKKFYGVEVGWRILMWIANYFHMSFELFYGLISFVMMFCIWKLIKKYSPYYSISLLLFYPVFYLTYCFSTLRQGLVMCLFLGLLLPLLIEEKYDRLKYKIIYIVSIFLLCSIHKCAIALIFLLFEKIICKKSINKIIFVSIGFIIAFFGYFGIFGIFGIFANIFGRTRLFSKKIYSWKWFIRKNFIFWNNLFFA